MITLNQLANARALQKYGNFRRAAEIRHLSQPAFSRSIQKLETLLGVRLFDRQAPVVKPTVYGEALLKRADTILVETNEIERETQLLKKFSIGNLSLAMGFYAAEISGSRAIAEMICLHPELRCQITIKDWHEVEEMVLDRRVDIGLAGTKHMKSNKQLQITPIGEHEFVFFCRSGHPLLELDNLSKSDLDAYPTVTVLLPPQMSNLFPGKNYLDKQSGHLAPSIMTGDQAAARTIVAKSNAFSVATPIQIEPWLRSGEISVLNFRKPWMKIDYGFIYRQDRMLAPVAESFMQHVREVETEVTQRNQHLMKELFP